MEKQHINLDTKAAVDVIVEFVTGHPVNVNDLVRLGHTSVQSGI